MPKVCLHECSSVFELPNPHTASCLMSASHNNQKDEQSEF